MITSAAVPRRRCTGQSIVCVEAAVTEMCRKLLANMVIEDSRYEAEDMVAEGAAW